MIGISIFLMTISLLGLGLLLLSKETLNRQNAETEGNMKNETFSILSDKNPDNKTENS